MPVPAATTAATRDFLATHPEAEAALTSLLKRDTHDEPWSFDDIQLDSGQFGELVARDLATTVDGGYRLTNPDAIRAGIEAGPAPADSPSVDTGVQTDSQSHSTAADSRLPQLLSRVTATPLTLLGLVGALLSVAGARLVSAPAVFRQGFVVSPANDAYFFRYWQERLASQADGLFDLTLFANMGGAASTRPAAHAVNWWVTVFLGGADTAPAVAAWLPVVASVGLGYLIYRFTRLLTGDVRVALAAVLFYGLAPINVVYTSVGFFDHQLHQYFWLGLLIGTLIALGVDVSRRAAQTDVHSALQAHARDPTMWAIALGLAIAVAGSAHSWGGSPLTFVPVASVIGFRVVLDTYHDISPGYANAPLLGGLTLGASLTVAAHLGLGWHESIAVATPALVSGGAIVAVGLGELWRRATVSPLWLLVAECILTIGGLFGYVSLRPDDLERAQTRLGDLFFREGAREVASLFSPDFAVIFGPLIQLGLGFYFAVAVLGVVTWTLTHRYEPGWLVLACFAWYYTLLATIQVRFAGQLAIVIAPFAGIGLVYLLAVVDIARPVTIFNRSTYHPGSEPTGDSKSFRNRGKKRSNEKEPITSVALPDGTRMRSYLIVTVALVLVFNLLLVPSLVGQLTHDRAQFDAALTVDDHADQAAREYPENFVLSRWGDNRMYNYFVSGESLGYGYAQRTHDEFLTSANPDRWYEQFQGRVGYLVVTDRTNSPMTNTSYAALYTGLGLGVNNTPTTGHYQLLAAEGGVRTFAVVPGATIQLSNSTGDVVTATTTVTIASESGNTTHEYTRSATVANGTSTIRVAYPGEYTVGNTSVLVTSDDILEGKQIVASAA